MFFHFNLKDSVCWGSSFAMLGAHLPPLQVLPSVSQPSPPACGSLKLSQGKGVYGWGPAQAFVDLTHHAAPPACRWPSRLPGTCQDFPKLPVSFSRFSLEAFYLAQVLFVCFASTAVQWLKELKKNEIVQLSSTALKVRMLSPLTPSFSELLYSLVKPSWLACILLHDTSLVKRPLVEGKHQWMRSVLHTKHPAYTYFCWQLHSSPYLEPQRIRTRNDYSARNFWFSPNCILLHFQQPLFISYVPVKNGFFSGNF